MQYYCDNFCNKGRVCVLAFVFICICITEQHHLNYLKTAGEKTICIEPVNLMVFTLKKLVHIVIYIICILCIMRWRICSFGIKPFVLIDNNLSIFVFIRDNIPCLVIIYSLNNDRNYHNSYSLYSSNKGALVAYKNTRPYTESKMYILMKRATV